jgi:hypothetical protein
MNDRMKTDVDTLQLLQSRLVQEITQEAVGLAEERKIVREGSRQMMHGLGELREFY